MEQDARRRELKRAACLLQGYRDSLTPEAAARIEPFARLLEGPAEALDWACPPPGGELSTEQRARIERAREVVSSLLAIAKSNPDHFAAVELVLFEIAESLENAS